MATTTEPIRIDPAATYTDAALSAALGISTRQLRTWRKVRRAGRPWFPRPFRQGRRPCWLGSAIVAWQEREQQAVA